MGEYNKPLHLKPVRTTDLFIMAVVICLDI